MLVYLFAFVFLFVFSLRTNLCRPRPTRLDAMSFVRYTNLTVVGRRVEIGGMVLFRIVGLVEVGENDGLAIHILLQGLEEGTAVSL